MEAQITVDLNEAKHLCAFMRGLSNDCISHEGVSSADCAEMDDSVERIDRGSTHQETNWSEDGIVLAKSVWDISSKRNIGSASFLRPSCDDMENGVALTAASA